MLLRAWALLGGLTLVAGMLSKSFAATSTWDAGGGDQNWGTATNWSANTIPLATDSVLFNDTGASNIPGTTTVLLDMARSVAGFTVENPTNKFHTFNLNGFALEVDGPMNVNTNISSATLTTFNNGSLILGAPASQVDLNVGRNTLNSSTTATLDLTSVNVNGNLHNLIVGEKLLSGGNATGTLNLGNNGSLTIGSASSLGAIYVGHASGGGSATGSVDLGLVPTLNATLSGIFVGTAEGGSAVGTLKLANTNNITAAAIRVGVSTTSVQQTPSSLILGTTNTIVTPELTVGGRFSAASLSMPAGGSLTLGSVATPTNLSVSKIDAGTDTSLGSTMSLSGSTFNATLSNLTVADRFSTGGAGNLVGSLTGGNSGAITIGSVANPGNFIVAHSAAGKTVGTVDFSGQTSLTANLGNMLIGTAETGVATGSVKLAATNNITANSIRVGYSTNDVLNATSTLSLGMNNTIVASEMIIGGQLSSSALDIPVGGSLTLGSVGTPTNLTVAKTGIGTDHTLGSTMSLSGATFNATLSNLTVGDRFSTFGSGSWTGSLTGGNSGAITIGSVATPGNVIIGHVAAPNGGGKATGTVDFSGQTSLTATLGNLLIGTSEVGVANGTFKLAATNNITANTIRVGYATNDTQPTSSVLSLGLNNTIVATEMTIGGQASAGQLDIPVGGSLTLGSAATPTNLSVAKTGLGANAALTSTMNLAGATFNATLSNLAVGDRAAASNSNTWTGSLTGGNSGAISVGSVATPGNIFIGRNFSNAGYTVGTVNLSGQTSLDAKLQNLLVGVGAGGVATGNFTLAKNNTIDAQTIQVGQLADSNSVAASSLVLGQTNSILADNLSVASNLANASLTSPAGAIVSLGSAARPTNVVVAQQTLVNSQTSSGTVDFSGAQFNAALSNLIVGERSGGASGTTTGTFKGGNSGAISIGKESQLATVNIGHAVDGGAVAGTVNLGGQNSLTAWIDQLNIGVATGGTARGALTLAKSNTIHANNITIGTSAVTDQPIASTLTLGLQQSIYAKSITVGGAHSMGNVSIANGGLLNLGTPDSRVDLSIGRNTANSALAATSTFDLTGGVTQAFLGSVVIGEKSGGGAGTGVGVFTTGATNNQIDATSIVLGQGTGSGTFNFNGGALTAQSITMGAGTGAFNWNAGTLHVQTFGAPVTPFSLLNNGVGLLAPGADAAAGLTTIYGSYQQAATAGMQIELGGSSPGIGGYDQVAISNVATLAGAFSVGTIDGFQPTLNEKFTVLVFGSRVGDFDNYVGLDLGNAILHPSYVGNSLVLEARSAIDGDVNLDGVVDIQDLTVIANYWLSTGPAGDANDDGIVDIQDITLAANHWLEQVGQGAGAGAGASTMTAVPEPSTWALTFLGAACTLAIGRRNLRKRPS